MDYHHHARLTIYRREELAKSVIQGRLSLKEAAAEFKLSRQSAAKWVERFRREGLAGLRDRSSRPHHCPRRTSAELAQRIECLRRQRWTGVRIAQTIALSRSTVSRILTRLRLNQMRMLQPTVPVVRYEHAAPGDLLHIDIKKLARIHKPGHRMTGNPQDETRRAGWEFLYVAIDDHSRIAFTAMLPNEQAVSASDFLHQAMAYFARLGIQVRRVMTDNGPCFCSLLFAHACRQFQLKHIRTRIYTPKTNGKAERFIQTAIREWAYARIYQNSAERLRCLLPWVHQYNWHRPHTSLDHKPPISRSGLDVNNLLTHH
ncbi:MAG TPA: IS481 family transposase, partial [Candidatus Acidoferrales bacterium]|nr:IS481 family transposase [Candidatus Acidoferrales bacterium]